jgi:hypothetical protein
VKRNPTKGSNAIEWSVNREQYKERDVKSYQLRSPVEDKLVNAAKECKHDLLPRNLQVYIKNNLFGLQAHVENFSPEYEVSQAASKIENFGRLN